jgi:hypothetical protein
MIHCELVAHARRVLVLGLELGARLHCAALHRASSLF